MTESDQKVIILELEKRKRQGKARNRILASRRYPQDTLSQEDDSFIGSRMLTPDEIASLRKDAKEAAEYIDKVFAKYEEQEEQLEKTQSEPYPQLTEKKLQENMQRARMLTPDEIASLREEAKKSEEYFKKVFQRDKDKQKH